MAFKIVNKVALIMAWLLECAIGADLHADTKSKTMLSPTASKLLSALAMRHSSCMPRFMRRTTASHPRTCPPLDKQTAQLAMDSSHSNSSSYAITLNNAEHIDCPQRRHRPLICGPTLFTDGAIAIRVTKALVLNKCEHTSSAVRVCLLAAGLNTMSMLGKMCSQRHKMSPHVLTNLLMGTQYPSSFQAKCIHEAFHNMR